MPRFVSNGPVVPDRLVQALEDDRVVIFCGAGISMGAGLPSYAGLVSYCYQELGEPLPPNKSLDWHWPDRMLGTLETRYGADPVRRRTAERLNIVPTDLAMHQAILKLARLRGSDGVRLVTTNFDTFFEYANPKLQLGQDFHSGPILPIPRNDHIASWKSLVYLHGRLAPPDHGNQHLVLTSADFGRAYLTEAWAARFVARLFAEFTVLFIGYSLNDPVLRYMTDAFAAEDALSRTGQLRGPAYIFVPHNKAPPDPDPWRDRHLEPIFYHEMRNHVRLKRTLVAWAEARDDYLSNIRVIISRIAPTPPEASDPSATDTLIWAIAGRPDDQGHGARIFAELNPPPPIQWLFELERHDSDERKRHEKAVKEARKSDRPPPSDPDYRIDPLFPPRLDNRNGPVSPTSFNLIVWLARSLGEIQLVDWVVAKFRSGRRPHGRLRAQIRVALEKPNTLPEGFKLFWRLVSSEGDWIAETLPADALWEICKEIAVNRDEPWLVQDILWACTPHLVFDASLYRALRAAETAEPDLGARLSHLVDVEVELNGEDLIVELVEAVDATPAPDAFWASNLDAIEGLFRRVLDLYAVVDAANETFDPSSIQRPSIKPHAQNHNHNKWGVLVDLIWRGWCHIDARDAVLSRQHVTLWRRIPYLGFRRLALAAIAHSAHFSGDEKLEALLHG